MARNNVWPLGEQLKSLEMSFWLYNSVQTSIQLNQRCVVGSKYSICLNNYTTYAPGFFGYIPWTWQNSQAPMDFRADPKVWNTASLCLQVTFKKLSTKETKMP